MKIGIITILKVNNYGAELQAFATQYILKKLGYNAEIIDYLFYKNKKHIKTKASSPVFTFPLILKIKEFLYPILERVKNLTHIRNSNKRNLAFENFHIENTSISKSFRSIDELYDTDLDYDVYIVGSDQVWNPNIYSSLEPYFLSFAPKTAKKISYASSFGVCEIPDYTKEYYKNKLQSLDSISVRENDAVDLVKKISGKTAQLVLDPTLLLTKDEWLKVAKPMHIDKSNYILIYELTPCKYIRNLANYIKERLGFEIIRICKSAAKEDTNNDILNICTAGPSEFLYLFSNAQYIITNSFHGTVFSLLFEKEFYTVLPIRKKNNSRQRCLLNLFGLTDRLLEENSVFPILGKTINYYNVKNILEKEKNKSIAYLKESIDGK